MKLILEKNGSIRFKCQKYRKLKGKLVRLCIDKNNQKFTTDFSVHVFAWDVLKPHPKQPTYRFLSQNCHDKFFKYQ